MRFLSITTIVVFVLAASSCSSCSEDPIANNGEDASGPSDAVDLDGTGADGTTGGDDECPRYQKKCDGSCVPTTVDPNHCGECGNACTGDQVCSAGDCTTDCLTGRSKCGNRCVNLDTDNDHCGSCDNACPDDEGCVSGSCVDRIDVDGEPDKCADGGPPIEIQPEREDTEQRKCIGRVVGRTFKWGICSCESIEAGNELYADGFDSTLGPYTPGGYGGSIGTNGTFSIGNTATIFGNLWASGDDGVDIGNQIELAQQLHSGGDFSTGASSTVGRDAFVEGNVEGSIAIDQTLHVRQDSQVDSSVTADNVVREDVQVDDPCSRCEESNRIPIDAIVDRRKENNDNDAIGLEADALADIDSTKRLDLPCGEYYLSGVDVGNSVTIVAHGKTALYIDGDLTAGNDFDILPAPSAELDVFVTGNVDFGNAATVGSPAYPASMRLYIGGEDGWQIGNSLTIGANVYAFPGTIDAGNDLEVFGGLYANRLEVGNGLTVHYDREVLDTGEDCPDDDPDPNDDPDAGTDAGPDGGSGDPDAGGGGDQCRTSGTACSEDSQCCTPLVCHEGACSAVDCVPLHSSCTSDADCCSGTCSDTGDGSVCVGS